MAKFASRGAAPHPARAPALDPESAPSHLKTLSAVCLDTLAVHGAHTAHCTLVGYYPLPCAVPPESSAVPPMPRKLPSPGGSVARSLVADRLHSPQWSTLPVRWTQAGWLDGDCGRDTARACGQRPLTFSARRPATRRAHRHLNTPACCCADVSSNKIWALWRGACNVLEV